MSISRQRKKRKSGKHDKPRKRKRKRKKRKPPNGRVLLKHLSTARIDFVACMFRHCNLLQRSPDSKLMPIPALTTKVVGQGRLV